MKTGIYRNVSNEDYHQSPGDSKSGLDVLRKSPARFRGMRTCKIARTSTKSQMTGTSIHAMTLEPELVARTYALPFDPPADALATVEQIKAALTESGIEFKSAAKKGDLESLVRAHLPHTPLISDLRGEYERESAGRVIIEREEWARLENMLAAIRAHPAAMKLLSAPGESELSAYWDEPAGDGETIRLRCRPDFWRCDGILVDLKSCSPCGASAEEFARSVDKWRYHVQHPMYLRGATSALNAMHDDDHEDVEKFRDFSPPRAFVFIVVETDACVVDGVSVGVAVYQLGANSVSLGEAELREDIRTLFNCYQSGKWPGYPEKIQPIELPAYAFTRAEIRMGASNN